MRKQHIASILLVTVLFIFGSVQQGQAQIQLGGGLAFGTDVEEIGLQVNGTYSVTPEIRIAPDFTYYFADDIGTTDVNYSELNVNGHYIFATNETNELVVYGLAGLHIAFIEVGALSDNDVGINLGTGLEYNVGFGNLFGEVKFNVGGFEQFGLAAGVRVPIGS